MPRPETEVLALVALETLEARPKPVVVDVGAGTGAIAVFLASRRPDATVIATDDSRQAVELARSNAARLAVDVDVRLGDLLDPVPAVFRGSVDLIVSNPPYVTDAEYGSLPRNVRADPDRSAATGGVACGRLRAEEVGE